MRAAWAPQAPTQAEYGEPGDPQTKEAGPSSQAAAQAQPKYQAPQEEGGHHRHHRPVHRSTVAEGPSEQAKVWL